MSLKILAVENASTPEDERVRLIANVKMDLDGYAIVDRTFDESGNVSNEFRHFFAMPDITLEKGQVLILFTGKGESGFKKYSNTNGKYYACYWGSDHCIWNNEGGDTASLIKYEVVDSQSVPASK